jgi:hypothetical protein
MKKLVLSVFASIICMVCNAEIQTKFWELELNKTYTSLEEAKKIINDRCQIAFTSKILNKINAVNGVFGGYEWKVADFYFNKTNRGYTFYMVSFFNEHISVDSANQEYEMIGKALTAKYGKPQGSLGNREQSKCWIKGSTGCYLVCIEEQGKHVIVLTYGDMQGVLQSLRVRENEL